MARAPLVPQPPGHRREGQNRQDGCRSHGFGRGAEGGSRSDTDDRHDDGVVEVAGAGFRVHVVAHEVPS